MGGVAVTRTALTAVVVGSILDSGTSRESSCLLVLSLATRVFFSGFSGLSPSVKINNPKFQFDLRGISSHPRVRGFHPLLGYFT
jgi:hypothetical protein